MTETLDIDTPTDARRYIELARESLLPPTTDRVQFGDGRWIEFSTMTDDEAVKIARSIYLDIELPVADGAKKQ